MLYPNRLAVPQHAAVDGEVAIADFVAVRRSLGQRGFHRGLAGGFEFFHLRRRSEKILRHVAALAEGGFEFLQNDKHLAVVLSRVEFWFDVHGSDLTAVLSGVQVRPSPVVRVIKTKTRRARSEIDAAHSMRRNEGGPFLCRS